MKKNERSSMARCLKRSVLLFAILLVISGCGSSKQALSNAVVGNGRATPAAVEAAKEAEQREQARAEAKAKEEAEKAARAAEAEKVISVAKAAKEEAEKAIQAAEAAKEEAEKEARAAEAAKKEAEEAAANQQAQVFSAPYDFTIAFAGDINLDENWATTQHLDQCAGEISNCISPELIERMRQADIMCLNNEFTYSNQGSPMNGKAFTFRAKPERVAVLQELGVDVVKLANNHIYDYGEQAFLDTLDVLDGAGIARMGAGRNLAEAMKPVYKEVGGKTVAFVAASRAEKNIMTPQASEAAPGILRCYDTALFKQVIAEARTYADFVIAYVHWGTEYSFDLEKVQLKTGKEYLDAGADVVIGAHSHCLQGMEYYKGKPICYSLGNYWFNEKTLDTMLVELHFYGEGYDRNLEVTVVPAIQAGCETRIVTDATEKERIFSFLENISVNVEIGADGKVVEKEGKE